MSRLPMPDVMPPAPPPMRCVKRGPTPPGVLYRMGQCVTQAYNAHRNEVIDTGEALEAALRKAGLEVYEL